MHKYTKAACIIVALIESEVNMKQALCLSTLTWTYIVTMELSCMPP